MDCKYRTLWLTFFHRRLRQRNPYDCRITKTAAQGIIEMLHIPLKETLTNKPQSLSHLTLIRVNQSALYC